jgi:hypothetical protein
MPSEAGLTQRGLVGLRLTLRDASLPTKYVFPFIDASWAVEFCVVDRLGGGPRILPGPVVRDDRGLTSAASLEDLKSLGLLDAASFAELVHFDPWWVFKGIGGVPRASIDAIIASNLAGSFVRDATRLKVHDLVFDKAMARLEALIAKDDAFHTIRLERGGVDLRALRRTPFGHPKTPKTL